VTSYRHEQDHIDGDRRDGRKNGTDPCSCNAQKGQVMKRRYIHAQDDFHLEASPSQNELTIDNIYIIISVFDISFIAITGPDIQGQYDDEKQ
jgi:hypothetical protein